MKTKNQLTRRQFLLAAGGALGASCLACTGLTTLALTRSNADYIEMTCAKGETMPTKILVAYASKCGSTGEVAQAIGQTLCDAGAEVDVRRVQDVKNLAGYQAVVLGSAARMGKLLPETAKFAQHNRKALAKLPTAYFTTGITMRTDTPETRQQAAGYLEPLRQVRRPVSEGLFAGVINYQKMEPLWRLMLSQAKDAMPEGDYRDWDAIRSWARSLAPAFLG